MKTTFTRFVLAAALAVMGLFAAPVSAAPLTISLSPMPVIGGPNDDIVIDVTVENTSGFEIIALSINATSLGPVSLGFIDTSTFDAGTLPFAIGATISSQIHFLFDAVPTLNEWESVELEFLFDYFTPNGARAFDSTLTGFRAKAVPEPTSMALFGLAAAGAAIARRRRA